MVLSNSQWLASTGEAYEIENSLRFNSADSAYLENADYSGSPTSGTDCTFSFWVKRSKLSSTQCLFFGGDSSGSTWEVIRFESDDQFRVGQASSAYDLITTQVFRDVASWYHFVVAFDTDNGTAGDRIKIYVNGSRVTDFSLQTNPSSGYVTNFNTGGSGEVIDIGFQGGGSNYCDLYLAEINFIDGQALTPTSFGEFSSTTGQWVPIDTSELTFGNNGYHLEFKDSSFIGKSTYQRTGNEGLIPQDAGTPFDQISGGGDTMSFNNSIAFDGATGTNYPNNNQGTTSYNAVDPVSESPFMGKDYGADNTVVVTGFKVYPTGDYGFDTWSQSNPNSRFSLQLQGSNDGTNFTNIGSANTSVYGNSSATEHKGLSNSTAYRYVRMVASFVSTTGSRQDFAFSELEFFGVGTYFSATNISTADQMTDTPTNNFCVLSPLDKFGGGLTLSDGNLRAVPSASEYCNNHGTFYIDSGKWVFECKHTTVFGEACGWSPPEEKLSGSSDRGYFMFADGRAYDNTTNTGTKGASLASGDFRYVFYDADAQAMWFAHVDVSSSNALVYDNSATKAEIEAGTTTNAVFTNIPTGLWAPGIWMDTSGVIEVNFGQSSFATSSDLPSGFNTLSAANLSDPTIADPSAYFQTTLYSGNSSTQEVNQSGNSTFTPGWVWIKPRNGSGYSHQLFDQVRGATKRINSDSTSTETTTSNTLTSFDSDGFSLGSHASVNETGKNMVAWQWKANGSGSSNTDGSVTSTVSAETTAGFSICKFNPGGNVNMTFGHGLGVAPRLVIVKNLEDATNWQVLHLDQGVGNKIFLNSSNAAASDANMWQNTAPTSTVVSMGTAQTTNEDVIAYCFAEIPGYSKFGSYTGNGSTDGPFIYLGFKPSWVMFKRTNAAADWMIKESSGRDPFNVMTNRILANTSFTDDPHSTNNLIDFVSNGMKHRAGSGTGNNAMNTSGSTYVYIAFAESPFKTANAR